MGLVLDSPVPSEILVELEQVSGAEGIRSIQLPE
jgi:hypothetical protein